MTQVLQQQAPLPAAPSAPIVLAVVPDAGQAEDGLLCQFIGLNALTFIGAIEEDPTEFLREMDKRFRLMLYEGP